MASRFYDGLYQINVQDGVVKMTFVNVGKSNEVEEVEIIESDDVVITVKALYQLAASVNDMINKINSVSMNMESNGGNDKDGENGKNGGKNKD